MNKRIVRNQTISFTTMLMLTVCFTNCSGFTSAELSSRLEAGASTPGGTGGGSGGGTSTFKTSTLSPTELVTNPDFENGMTGFTGIAGCGSCGRCRPKFFERMHIKGSGGYFGQEIAVTPGRTYRVSVYGRAANGNAVRPSLCNSLLAGVDKFFEPILTRPIISVSRSIF